MLHFFLFLLLPPPPISTLFPYTTLFRSWSADLVCGSRASQPPETPWHRRCPGCRKRPYGDPNRRMEHACLRSEEHTSELQSRLHLVCRLLLEKKKHIKRNLNLPIQRTPA